MNELLFTFASFLAAIITGLFYNRLLKRDRLSKVSTLHNLPAPSSQFFVGRENEISQLYGFLNPKNPKNIAGVFGMGGIGKTTLLVEIGHRCVTEKLFDVILYIPARRISLLENQRSEQILDNIISTAIFTLDIHQNFSSEAEKESFIRASFSQKRTLLLVDGLDETREKEQKELLLFLFGLPSQTKIVISSRQIIDLPFSITLDALTFNEYQVLFRKELESANIKLDDENIQKLYQMTGGLPLAIKWVTSLLKNYSLETVLSKFKQSDNNMLELVLEPVIQRYFNKHPERELLLTIANGSTMLTIHEIATITGLSDNLQSVEEGLVNLTQVSLISKSADKYLMHPLVKEYVLSKTPS